MEYFYKNNFRLSKAGMTILEAIAILLIVAIFAALGLSQYGRVAERSRGSEPRGILPMLRFNAETFYNEQGNFAGFAAADAGIGSADEQAPSACRSSHFFSYDFVTGGSSITITATRCAAGGKTPQGALAAGNTLWLSSDFSDVSNVWGGTGAY